MQKEKWEWIHSWCDETNDHDLPRVLLVGDSITYGYEKIVREKLRGICRVDFVATSYAVDTKMYNELIKNFVADSNYAAIHFNHGLHGDHMSKRTYKSRVKRLIEKCADNKKIIMALSTFVYQQGNKKADTFWKKKVSARNEAMREIAAENGYAVDDLYAVSVQMPKEYRHTDGTHYLEEGYALLAEAVVESIKSVLN